MTVGFHLRHMQLCIMTKMTAIYLVSVLFIVLIEASVHDSVGCKFDEFSCINGQCISKLNWCDGIEHCKDSSDENYCRRHLHSDPNDCADDPSFFLCEDGRCIPVEGMCDGVKTCDDGSDENNCISTLETSTLEATPDHLESNFEHNRKDQQFTINFSSESKYFSDFHNGRAEQSLNSARDWLLLQWNEETGWGDDTARAIIAFKLSKTDNSNKREQEMLISKQLDVQLSVALRRNSTKELSLCELSHYINALSASCKSPRNFNGYDLVSLLRDKVDALNNRNIFVTPYVYLTLCLHNFTRYEDILNIRRIVSHKEISVAENFDMLSLSVLATSCAVKTRSSYNPNFRTDIVFQLTEKIEKSGLPKNVYELSLVVQALTEARADPSEWGRAEALDYILNSQNETGSFGDFLSTYYTIPILAGKTMMDLSAHCSTKFIQEGQQTDLKHSKIHVLYSLYFGYPVEITQQIKLQIPEGSNFLNIMRIAQEENENFRFQLEDSKDIPFVYSIGGEPNDPERGIYWTLYIKSHSNRSDLIRLQKDICQHIPKDNEESVFWLRPIESR